jgi:hypothetical protein
MDATERVLALTSVVEASAVGSRVREVGEVGGHEYFELIRRK